MAYISCFMVSVQTDIALATTVGAHSMVAIAHLVHQVLWDPLGL